MTRDYARWAGWMRSGALLSTLLLLAIIAFETLVAPSGGRRPNPVVWIALSLPLLIFLPGLWRGGLRSYAWLSFVSLLYFAQAVTALFAVQQPAIQQPAVQQLAVQQLALQPYLLAWLDVFAGVALFSCTLLFIRWRARADRALAT